MITSRFRSAAAALLFFCSGSATQAYDPKNGNFEITDEAQTTSYLADLTKSLSALNIDVINYQRTSFYNKFQKIYKIEFAPDQSWFDHLNKSLFLTRSDGGFALAENNRSCHVLAPYYDILDKRVREHFRSYGWETGSNKKIGRATFFTDVFLMSAYLSAHEIFHCVDYLNPEFVSAKIRNEGRLVTANYDERIADAGALLWLFALSAQSRTLQQKLPTFLKEYRRARLLMLDPTHDVLTIIDKAEDYARCHTLPAADTSNLTQFLHLARDLTKASFQHPETDRKFYEELESIFAQLIIPKSAEIPVQPIIYKPSPHLPENVETRVKAKIRSINEIYKAFTGTSSRLSIQDELYPVTPIPSSQQGLTHAHP